MKTPSVTLNPVFIALEQQIAIALSDIGGVMAKNAYKLIRESGHYATRRLMSSITFEIVKRNQLAFALKFGTNVPYAQYVHEGRLPGKMPPIDAIKNWIKAKRLRSTTHDIDGLALAIARKIKHRGIPPFPFLRIIVSQSQQLIESRLQRLMQEVTNIVQQ